MLVDDVAIVMATLISSSKSQGNQFLCESTTTSTTVALVAPCPGTAWMLLGTEHGGACAYDVYGTGSIRRAVDAAHCLSHSARNAFVTYLPYAATELASRLALNVG